MIGVYFTYYFFRARNFFDRFAIGSMIWWFFGLALFAYLEKNNLWTLYRQDLIIVVNVVFVVWLVGAAIIRYWTGDWRTRDRFKLAFKQGLIGLLIIIAVIAIIITLAKLKILH